MCYQTWCFEAGFFSHTTLKPASKASHKQAVETSSNTHLPLSRSLTRLLKPGVNKADLLQFLIPPLSKMDMTGDLVYNWEFFRDSSKNYATAMKLADRDKKKFVASTLLSVMGKECLHV